jgi:uncharacterized membrane protein
MGSRLAIGGVDEARPRLAAVDLARGVAIVAMVVYHGAFDLSAARLIAVDVPTDLAWKVLARLTAGSFLLLVGVSLVLATQRGLDRNAFLRRLLFIAGAAALVSLSTWWFNPRTFVFFGILHAIALASVLALPFLRLPSVVVAAAATFFLALPWFFAAPVFAAWPLLWVGLAPEPPVSVDYVPVFPWFGVVLAGIVVGRLLLQYGGALWHWRPTSPPLTWLMIAGRWSLVIYLVHQPLLVGAVSLASMYLPANEGVARANFIGACTPACGPGRDGTTCEAFCTCMFDGMWGKPIFDKQAFEEMTSEERVTFDALLAACDAAPALSPIPAD